MAQFSTKAINQTLRDIRRATGLDVSYNNGQWFANVGGKQVSLARNKDTFDAILAQNQAALSPAPTSGAPTPPPPNATVFVQGHWRQAPTPGAPSAPAPAPSPSYPTPGPSSGGRGRGGGTSPYSIPDDYYLGRAYAAHQGGNGPGSQADIAYLRAVVPGSYRQLLRRTLQLRRGAMLMEAQGTTPGLLGRIGLGISGGYGVGSAFGGFAGGLGGAIGGLLGTPFGLGGAAIGGGIGAGMATAGVGLVSSAFSLLRTVTLGVAGGLTALAGALVLAVHASQKYAQDIISLSQQTGIGLRGSAAAVGVAAALGIAPGDISHSNILQSRASARIYGGSGLGDEADVRAFRAYVQRQAARGPLGLLTAQNMAELTGKGAYMSAALAPADVFNRQLKRGGQLTAALGMNPEQLETAGFRIKGVFDTISQGGSLLWAKIGGSVAEKIQPLLDKALDWLAGHSDKVADFIVKAVDAGWNALVKFGTWLYADLPVIATNAGLSILKFLKSVDDGIHSLWQGLAASPFGKALGIPAPGGGGGTGGAAAATGPLGVSGGATGGVGAGGGAGGGGESWWDRVKDWGATGLRFGAAAVVGRFGIPLAARGLMAMPWWAKAGVVAGAAGYQFGLRHWAPWFIEQTMGGENAATRWMRTAPGIPEIAGHYGGALLRRFANWGLTPALGPNAISAGGMAAAGGSLISAASGQGGGGTLLDRMIAGLEGYQKSLGTSDERRETLTSMLQELKGINKNTTEMAASGRRSMSPDAWAEAAGRLGSYIVEDAAIGMDR